MSNSPTLTVGMTAAGAILGTAAYMAPEQARAKKLDKRVDIWSFGVVLYEMITGERLFRGEDAVEILAAVVHGKPDLSSARIPPNVRRVLERCMEKDPRKRLRDISGVALLLEDRGTEVASLPKGRLSASSKVAWAVAAGFALTALAAVWFMWPAAKPLDASLERDAPNFRLHLLFRLFSEVVARDDWAAANARAIYSHNATVFTHCVPTPGKLFQKLNMLAFRCEDFYAIAVICQLRVGLASDK